MYRLLRILIFLFPAETAHHLGIAALALLGKLTGLCRMLRARVMKRAPPSLKCTIAGLSCEHPIWLAAGLDKDAVAVDGLFALGFGAVEIGTLTPKPQPGNPQPRLFRMPKHKALINRMGFNNGGAAAAGERLKQRRWHPAPLGVNIGKNKDTPLDDAENDYVKCVEALGEVGDYVVVNASSPNTPGLRQLQEPERLTALLKAVRAQVRKPLFLKIAPDLSPEAVDAAVDAALACGLDGLIATNTTVERPFPHPEAGGLSGAPLREVSTEIVRRAYQRSAGRFPIIGVGGVFSAEDAYKKIRAGASAVQLYTGFIYEGPGMVWRLLPELAVLLRRDGFQDIADAIGADVPREPSTARCPTK
ncbi:MAG: quinone-dependent dihydroorotate dehydrogenase [Myxococcaceae bacterium]